MRKAPLKAQYRKTGLESHFRVLHRSASGLQFEDCWYPSVKYRVSLACTCRRCVNLFNILPSRRYCAGPPTQLSTSRGRLSAIRRNRAGGTTASLTGDYTIQALILVQKHALQKELPGSWLGLQARCAGSKGQHRTSRKKA